MSRVGLSTLGAIGRLRVPGNFSLQAVDELPTILVVISKTAKQVCKILWIQALVLLELLGASQTYQEDMSQMQFSTWAILGATVYEIGLPIPPPTSRKLAPRRYLE